MEGPVLCQEMLLSQGYKRFSNPLADSFDPQFNAFGYQKRVSDSVGIRYFIDVMEYNWKNIAPARDTQFSYTPEVHLYNQNGDALIRIVVLSEEHTASLTALEAYVDSLWRQLGAGYYERFDDE